MPTLTTILQPPALEIDAVLGRPGANGILERRIVWNLLHHLSAAGFRLRSVYDGEEDNACADNKAAMELVFNLDESRVYFQKAGFAQRNVLLVNGNGIDMVSDWSYQEGDRDGFNAAMEAFDAEDFA